jgi:hypothetical protein
VKSPRILAAVLFVLPALAACGDDATPTATATPASSAAVVTSAPAPATSSPAAVTSALGAGDRELCASANAAKKDLGVALAAGTDPGKAMAKLSDTLTATAASGDGEVATAMKAFAAEAAKAATEPDPMKAAASAAFTKAGERFDEACAGAGR